MQEWEAAIGFLTADRADVRRHPPGVHPALRRPRASPCSSRPSTAGRRERHREHRPRPVPHRPPPPPATRRLHRPDGHRPAVRDPRPGAGGRTARPAGRRVDVWQCTKDGFYDVQQPDVQPPGNGRGLFTNGRRGPLLVPHRRAQPLPDPRPTARSAGCSRHRPPPLPARPHPLHRRCPGHTRSPRTSSSPVARTSTPTRCSRSRRAWSPSSRRSRTRPRPNATGSRPFRKAEIDLVLQAHRSKHLELGDLPDPWSFRPGHPVQPGLSSRRSRWFRWEQPPGQRRTGRPGSASVTICPSRTTACR